MYSGIIKGCGERETRGQSASKVKSVVGAGRVVLGFLPHKPLSERSDQTNTEEGAGVLVRVQGWRGRGVLLNTQN